MKTFFFIFSYAACAILDAAVTGLCLSLWDFSPFIARAAGALAAIAAFICLQKAISESRSISRLLATSIGIISTVVSYGLFALLLLRNPLLQWHAAHIAATAAALLLCGFGYRRARRRHLNTD